MLIKVILGFLIGAPISFLSAWYCHLFEVEMCKELHPGQEGDFKTDFKQLILDSTKGPAQITMMVGAVGFGCIAYYVAGWMHFAIAAIFFSALLIVSIVDLRTCMIPDSVLVVGAVIGLPLLVWAEGFVWLVPAALGVALGGGILLFILVASKGGMGWGDVKLAVFMGVFLGWQGILTAFFIAFVTGGLYGVFLMVLRKKKKGDEIPFGPFLALGGIIAVMASQSLIQWYLAVLAG